MTAPATRPNQSNPATAVLTSSAVDRSQPAEQQDEPRRDDAALHQHDRHAVEHRLDAVLADRRAHPSTVDGAQVAVHRGRGRGELDRAGRLQRRHERAPEARAGRRRGRRRAAGHRRAEGRRRGGQHHHREQHPAGEQAAARDGRHHHDDQAVDEIDPAVGVAREAVGVHRPPDDLTGGGARQPVLHRLAAQHRQAHPQHHGDPPQRVDAEGPGHQDGGGEQAEDQPDRRGDRTSALLQRLDHPAPEPAGAGPERADQRGAQEQQPAADAPALVHAQHGQGGAGQARAGADLLRRAHLAEPAARRESVPSGRERDLVRVARRPQQLRERSGLVDQARPRARLHHPTARQDGDRVGTGGRGQPVRDDDAGAPGQQPLGGADDARLGERVHPCGRLVEHDHLHVAHQQAAERHQLLLTRRQRRPARAEHGVEAVRQRRHPLGLEPERVDGAHDGLPRASRRTG